MVFDSNLSLIGRVTTLKRVELSCIRSHLTEMLFMNFNHINRWSCLKLSFTFSFILINNWPIFLTHGSLISIVSSEDISL